VNAYEVVAKDKYSVAVVSFRPMTGKQITHIHFEGEHYWIYLGPVAYENFLSA
jgi:hypothetical protein